MKFVCEGKQYDLIQSGHLYNASDVNWNHGWTEIKKACKEQGFKVVAQGSAKSCYQMWLKKI